MHDLSAPRILEGLVGTRFSHVEVHPSIDSTQTTLVSEGGRDGRVVVADHQTAGRGRQGRSWLDVPGGMLMFSALMRGISPERASQVALAGGVAVVRAVEESAGVEARLKWPNDVRIGGKKVCGMLGELAPPGWSGATPSEGHYVVLGIGTNVGHEAGELPEELGATSLRIASGKLVRRDDLCVSILRELDVLVGADDLMDSYRRVCETIGRQVRVELADGKVEGTATDVRDDGALMVDGWAVVAGDVVHLR